MQELCFYESHLGGSNISLCHGCHIPPSGILRSPGLLLSYYTISLASIEHKHYTNNNTSFYSNTDEHIRTAIANANGPRPSLFVPEIAFDLLVKKQIEKLLQPGLQCVDLVFDEMQRMAFQSENPELSRFPELRDRMFEIVQLQLRAAVAPTQKMITNLISIELAYINTSHPDFIGGKQAVAQLNKRFQQQQQQTFEQGQSQNKDGNGNSKTSVDSQNPNAASPDVPRWAMPNSSTDGQSNGNGSSGTNGNGNNAAGLLSMEGAASGAGGKAFFNIFKGPSSTTSNNMGNSMASMNGSMGDKGSPGPSLQRDSSLIRLPNVPDKMRSNGSNHPTERERVETEIIKALIASYFDIVKKNFTDLVRIFRWLLFCSLFY